MRSILRIDGDDGPVNPGNDAKTHDRTLPPWAAAIVRRRKALGLRQEDLADLAEVSHRFVQSLEAGKPSVRLDKLEAVLSALGLCLDVVPADRGHR